MKREYAYAVLTRSLGTDSTPSVLLFGVNAVWYRVLKRMHEQDSTVGSLEISWGAIGQVGVRRYFHTLDNFNPAIAVSWLYRASGTSCASHATLATDVCTQRITR